MRPELKSCTREGGVVVLRTEFRGLEFAFSIRPDSFLPFRVALSQDAAIASYELRNYTSWGGVQLPMEIVVNSRLHGSNRKELIQYEINPVFDPKIFDGTLRRDLGPDQWILRK
jgi:hypothetical protein